jgi:DNA mismatch repair protein MSH2
MEKLKNQVADNIGVEQEKAKLERAPNLKMFYFRIPRALERNLRTSDDLIVLETRKDGVHFTNTKLKRLTERFFEFEADYGQKQKEIVNALGSKLREFSPVFQILSDVLAEVDLFSTMAAVSSSAGFCRPVFADDSDRIYLEQARHPLVEKRCSYIPSTIEMKRGESSFVIISGPNSAGKSTLLKTVGICVYLAHIGCFVPCDKAVIPITSSIHARVGAWDSFQMSTFTVEMTEMASILESAQKSSLVLVDELGRSTSCSDGFGLAWTISKRLAKDIGAFCLFATHFHELCNLDHEIDCVTNCHMNAEARVEEGLLMLYQLKPGPFPKSFGIDAADHAGFPPSVLRRAREKAVELEIADGESGDVVRHVRIDPNEPYVNLLRKMLKADFENQTMGALVAFVKTSLADFDEEVKKNRSFFDNS